MTGMRRIFTVPILAITFTVAAIAQTTHQPVVAADPDPVLDPAKVFSDNCAACHQEDGKGIEGAFPALAGDKFVLGPPTDAIHVVLDGRAGMPTFKADLTDAQIAAALTYVRTSWGNMAAPVRVAEVAALRTGAAPVPEDKKPITAH